MPKQPFDIDLAVRRLRKAGARIAHLTRLAGLDHAPEHH